mgnify:CR=1 FL=1
MKAIVVYEPGGPEQLVYTDVPRPTLKDGWSLVRVRGFGVNHSEIFTRQGLSPSVTFPRILGIECVGTVEETTDAENLPVGKRVVSLMGEMGRAFDGGYAEYVLLPNEQIYPVESKLPWDVFAAIPETYYTAFGSLRNLRVTDGNTVLVRGGASGVGIAFLRLLRARFPQMHIDGSTRRSNQRERLIVEGYSDIVIEEDGVLCTRSNMTVSLIWSDPLPSKTACSISGAAVSCAVRGSSEESGFSRNSIPLLIWQRTRISRPFTRAM